MEQMSLEERESGWTSVVNVPNTQGNLNSASGFSLTLIIPRFSAAHKTQGKLCASSYLLQGPVIGSTKFPFEIPLPSQADVSLCGWVGVLIFIILPKSENNPDFFQLFARFFVTDLLKEIHL